MQRSSAKRRVASAAPQPAIALHPARGSERGNRHGLALVVFMRCTAAIWLAQGLLQWSAVLATTADGQSPLAALAPVAMAATFFFAVMDFVAAVGLWLAAPWGGVLWLVAIGAQLLAIVVMPGFFDHPVLTGIVDIALMAAYLALVWSAALAAEADS